MYKTERDLWVKDREGQEKTRDRKPQKFGKYT